MSDETTLPLRAENNPKFYSRFKWLGLAAFGFAAWSVYDGAINYPSIEERGKTLIELAEKTLDPEVIEEINEKATHGEKDVYLLVKAQIGKSEELKQAWIEAAEINNWPLGLPKKLKTQADVPGQYGMAVIAVLAGVWFWFTVYRTNGRWFELGEKGITSRWGESFALGQITSIDKKQWRDKGIAYVKYADPGGATKTFVVDNYKYHRATTDQILFAMEQAAGIDKIVNGPPEEIPKADAESADAASPDVQPSEA